MDNNTPVCSAVNKIIDLFDLNEKVKVCSYKEEERFKELWNYPETGQGDNPQLTKLIVWDGIPQSGPTVNTGKYLTPIDWAVGYSLSIANKAKESKHYPDLRIIILDVDSQSVSDSDSLKFVYQSSNMDVMSMPWIRIFSTEATCSGRDMEAFFRTLVNLGSDSVGSKDSDSDGSEFVRKPAEENEEDKTPTLPPPEVCTPSAERPFLRLKRDAIFTNIRKLVDSFWGCSESGTLSELVEEDTKPLPSRGQDTSIQTPDYERNTEIRDEPFISMKEAFAKENSDKENRDLEIIKNIWAAFLTRPSTPGDHHALANLVGPLLLMEDEGGDLHVNALQELMGSIGLLPDRKKEDASKEDNENAKAVLDENNAWISWKAPEDGPKPLKLILIDDMFDKGWGKMLCWAMGVKYQEEPSGDHTKGFVEISRPGDGGKDEQIVIKATSSADWIIEKKLEKLTKTDNRFNFTLDGGVGQEILFLDLRLYPGSRNFKNEVDFFKRLTALADKHFKKETNKNLPWPGITSVEISEIQKWIKSPDKEQEDPEYIKALTLLPRILALTDLSLPIVLFSSTGRRDITEKLKDYGNIITVFEKPRFTIDIPVDIALQTKTKFRDAMEKALHILQARQKIQRISTYKIEEPHKFDCKGIHVELFIDECLEDTSEMLDSLPSGINFPDTIKEKIYYNANNKRLIFKEGKMEDQDKKILLSLSNDDSYQSAVNELYRRSGKKDEIYVGGLFTIFMDAINIESALKRADGFDDDLVKKGVRYFDSLGVGTQRSMKGCRGKGKSSHSDLSHEMENSKHKPNCLGFIGLRHLLPADTGKFDLSNPKSADNLFRLTLTALIELFLSETLPALFDSTSDNVSVSIYACTRVKYYKTKGELNKPMFHFGLTSFSAKDGHYLYSLNRDSVCPMISDIINFHNVKRKIYRAAGIKLPYKNENVVFPEYFICRRCETVVSINPHRNIKTELIHNSSINVATITTFAKNRFGEKITFIRTIETGTTPQIDALVDNISGAKIGDIVTYDKLIQNQNERYKAIAVRLLTDKEMSDYNKTEKKYSLHDIDLECTCKNGQAFSPDYRALHYIADEILNHIEDVYSGRKYGESIKKVLGGFDDVLNEDLKSVIKASRYLDIEETVSAIAEVKVTEDYKSGDYRVKPLLLQRIASKLDKLTGDEFIKLVQIEKEILKKREIVDKNGIKSNKGIHTC